MPEVEARSVPDGIYGVIKLLFSLLEMFFVNLLKLAWFVGLGHCVVV